MTDEVPADAPPPAKKSRKGLVFALLGILVLGGGGAGGWFYWTKHKAAAGAEAGDHAATGEHGAEGKDSAAVAATTYVPLDPAFVVNLEDQDVMRFMQVEVQVTVRDVKVADDIKNHLPLIRNKLMLLFSGQTFASIATRADKEKLQQQALAEVQAVLKEKTGKPGIDALYFTSLVTQ